MEITELILKNFGKFTEKDIRFSEGVNLIYGENGSGKSTIHTFLKGMLYGMERGRGRAAASDAYSRYEPWDNPNYYAGVMRFRCGNRNFSLERHFDKYTKSSRLFCEDDGEELSIAHGDLEMLLGGMRESDYENTIAIAQLRAVTGPALAAGLKNYAANYYASGNSEINLEGAIAELKERKKELDKEVREKEREKQVKRDKLEAESSYIWRELSSLEKEMTQVQEEYQSTRKKWEAGEKERRRKIEQRASEGVFDRWRIHPVEVIGMLAAVVISFLIFDRPWNFLVAIVIALAEVIYVWNCLKDGKKKKLESDDAGKEEGRFLSEQLGRQSGKLEKLQEDYREKKIQQDNIQEQLEELDVIGEDGKARENRRKALDLAEETILKVSKEMQDKLSRDLNDKVSAILKSITDGKYEKVWMDENLHMRLLANGRSVAMEQVSRGTLEQIFFALRMAAAEVLYEEEYPVILDDTFAYYDDVRLEATLKWLAENRRQVLIFTCQKREEELLEKVGCPYAKIEIE